MRRYFKAHRAAFSETPTCRRGAGRFKKAIAPTIFAIALECFAAPSIAAEFDSFKPSEAATTVNLRVAGRVIAIPLEGIGDGTRVELQGSNAESLRHDQYLRELLRQGGDATHPANASWISIAVANYGQIDFDGPGLELCPMFSQEWAREVCTNQSSPIVQALPFGQFGLFDIGHIQSESMKSVIQCRDEAIPKLPSSQTASVTAVCPADVWRSNQFVRYVVRIDGDLGAIWTGKRADGAENLFDVDTLRQGQAIRDFVRLGLMEPEEFLLLIKDLCALLPVGKSGADTSGTCRTK